MGMREAALVRSGAAGLDQFLKGTLEMKKAMWLGAAATALLMAAPAHADSGYLGLSYQNGDAGGGDIDSVAASGAFSFGDHFQANGHYVGIDTGVDLNAWNLGGHLFSRSEQGMFGGYLGYNSLDVSGGAGSLDEWTIAGVGAAYMNRSTLSGAISYTDGEFGGDVTQTALDGEWRHFMADNFSIQANGGYASVDFGGGGGDATFWSAGIGAEAQMDSVPISIYGGYQYTDLDGANINSLGVGVRYNFGGGTLFDRNHSGAGLNRPQGFIERLFGEFKPR